jgi:hypothetical protein
MITACIVAFLVELRTATTATPTAGWAQNGGITDIAAIIIFLIRV